MKRLAYILPLTLSFIATLAHAETVATSPPTSSVFFTTEELREIEEKVEIARRENPSANSDRINLGAIIFMGENNWKIWLQGRMRTPDTASATPRIIDVTPHSVKIAVPQQNDGAEIEVTLRPHQTYRISTGEIVEGN